MLVPEIHARVYAITGLTTSHPRLTTAVIESLWWEGAVRMVREARPGYLRRTSLQNLVANQAEYKLPVDSLIILGVLAQVDGDWRRLRKKTEEELDELAPGWDSGGLTGWSGPGFYHDSGIHTTADADHGKRKITLVPTPTVAVTNGLKVRDIRLPILLANNPVDYQYVDLPADYHEGCCVYAGWKFLKNFSENPRQDLDSLLALYNQDKAHFVASQREEMEYDHESEARLPVATNSWNYWSSL